MASSRLRSSGPLAAAAARRAIETGSLTRCPVRRKFRKSFGSSTVARRANAAASFWRSQLSRATGWKALTLRCSGWACGNWASRSADSARASRQVMAGRSTLPSRSRKICVRVTPQMAMASVSANCTGASCASADAAAIRACHHASGSISDQPRRSFAAGPATVWAAIVWPRASMRAARKLVPPRSHASTVVIGPCWVGHAR